MLKRGLKLICFACLLILFLSEAFPQNAGEITSEIRKDIDKEEIRRQEIELRADESVEKARISFENDEYSKAVDYYLEAIKELETCSLASKRILSKIKKIKEAIAEAYYYWAEDLSEKAEEAADVGQYDEAIELCRKAIEINPSAGGRMEDLIDRYKKASDVAKFRDDTSERLLDPQKEERLYNIDVLYEQGKKLFKDNQLDKARDKFEEILLQNPYHLKAINYIKQINDKMYDAGTQRLDLTITERLAEAEWKYVSPILPRTLAGEKEPIGGEAILKDEGTSAIQKKLEEIIIDHIEFEEVTIPTVVKYLKNRSKDLDPEGQGVNIFLRLGTGADTGITSEEKPDEEEDEGFLDEEEVDETLDESGGGSSDITITMVVDDIPLGEAIRYICRSGNLKYRVEKFAVVIASQDVALDELETRIYPVEQEAFSELGGGGEEGGEGAEAAEGGSSIEPYFRNRGITFPEGSKIVYDNRISRLIATNTPDNLAKIEEIIKELNVVDPQVLIEAKFIEVRQDDLDSLGFEWLISRSDANRMGVMEPSAWNPITETAGVATFPFPWYYSTGGTTTLVPANTPQAILANGTDTATFPFPWYHSSAGTRTVVPANTARAFTTGDQWAKGLSNSATRFGQNDPLLRFTDDTVTGFGAGDDQLFNMTQISNSGVSTQAIIHALDRMDSSNILSTPRLTTQNGEEATIRMVTEQYFPESWGEATVLSIVGVVGIGSVGFIPSIPEFGDPTEVGVRLTVTPTVDADRYTISLDMIPIVQAHVGWTDYSYNITIGGVTVTNTLRMAIIESRTVETQITIYDGETVVMGGTIRDTSNFYDDRIPLLGDIPLLGRLFRSEVKDVVKENLLIFTTVRLVNPDGSPLREREIRGKPPFRQ